MVPAPLVIEAAINGGTQKSRNANVPRSVDEIVASGCAAVRAGATVVHNHNDEPNLGGSGRHSSAPYLQAWRQIRDRHPEVLLYPTMAGGGPGLDIETRNRHQVELAEAGLLPMALVDPGTANVGGADRDGNPEGGELVYQNTFGDTRHLFAFTRERGIPAAMSIYEPGFLALALAYERAGLLSCGGLVRLYFCGGGPFLGSGSFLFGLPPTAPALEAYLDMLSGSRLPWMVAVLGGDAVGSGMAELAIRRGGHVRVGLEDYSGPGQPTNEELVSQVQDLAAKLGRPVAGAAQAHQILVTGTG